MKTLLWPHGAPYSTSDEPEDIPSIQVYLVDMDRPTAAVLVCPGGGYERRAEHEGAPVAAWLNSLGISAFVLNYRVAPYKHPVPLLDAQRAIRYIRHNADQWNIDHNKIGILGFSAGGHLAVTVGTKYDTGDRTAKDPVDKASSRPDFMILCYPVISFTEYQHEGSMINLLGENPDQDLCHLLSNERQVTPNTPKSFIWHTADDASVPVENSMLFAQAMSKNKVSFELHVYPNGRHGMGLAEGEKQVGSWTKLCASWLKKGVIGK